MKTLIKNNKGFDFKDILYKKESIKDFSIPIHIEKDYELFNKKWNSKERNDFFRNQDNLCISNFYIKDKKIYLNFCEAKYIERQIYAECFSMMNDLDKEMFLSDFHANKIKAPMSYKFQIGIITKDNKILILKRSNKVTMNKGKYDFSISKNAKPEDVIPKTFQPYNTVLRGLKEELNIDIEFKDALKEEIISLKSIFLNNESFALTIYAEVDLRKSSQNLTSEEIEKLMKDAKNNWEYADVLFIENSPVKIKKEVKSILNKFTNSSINQIESLLEKK